MTALYVAAMVIMLACASIVPVRGQESPMQDSVQDVKRRHEAELMAMPGVVSIGIGRDEGGRAVLIIGLERDDPHTRAQLPRRLEGYDVRTEVVGKIRPR
jgi:hypothetical protein